MNFIDKLRWNSYYGDYALFVSQLELNSEAQFLDLGCQSGEHTLRFASRVGTKNITGIDIKKWRVPFELIRADLECELPLKGNSFDVITASHVIEHISNTDLFVREIHRILKVGGYILIATPNLASGRVIFELIFDKQPNTAHVSDQFILRGDPTGEWRKSKGHLHKRLFTVEGMSKLLGFYNLKVEYARGTGYGPFVFGRILNGLYAADLVIKARKCGQ